MQESFPTGTLGPNSAGTLGQWGLHYGFFTIPSRISCPYQPQQHGRKGLRKIFEPLGGFWCDNQGFLGSLVIHHRQDSGVIFRYKILVKKRGGDFVQ